MMGFGLLVCGFASLQMTGLNLEASYTDFVVPRMILGVGLAFLFIPLNLIAYSYLPPEKNNKASSLTNLFRNLGGSFGVAFVATMLARRSQFHQSTLVSHISVYDKSAVTMLENIRQTLIAAGVSSTEAPQQALATIYLIVQKQASMLAFLDAFWLLSLLALFAAPFVIFIENINRSKPPGAGH